MVVAELSVRHTRRNMPTRRVALGSAYLPMVGSEPGAVLLRVLVAQCVGGLDDDQRAALPRLLHDARDGLRVPRIALRHRLQTDVHGLDRSRHRLVAEGGRLVAEIDVHGRSVPQLAGAVLAASGLRREHRRRALAAVEAGVRHPGSLPGGVEVRYVDDPARLWSAGPWAPGSGRAGGPGSSGAWGGSGGQARPGEGWSGEEWSGELRGGPGGRAWDGESWGGAGRDGTGWGRAARPGASWEGVTPERRWAMEVLGFAAGAETARAEVQRRFRRLVREAHPDHGGRRDGAARRLADLADARAVLLGGGSVPYPGSNGSRARGA